MAGSFSFQKGGLYKISQGAASKYLRKRVFRIVRDVTFVAFPLVGSWLLLWWIYVDCITPQIDECNHITFSLLDRITTGALFATFGSAVVSAFALAADRHLRLFYENLSILTQEIAADDVGSKWRRWPFLPRFGQIHLHLKEEKWAVGIENARIRFTIADFDELFPLPTTVSDFRELPILMLYIQMRLHRSDYLRRLSKSSMMRDYPAWDCVCALYANILLYRSSLFAIWIGACLILQSVVFTFLYPLFYALLA